METYIISYNQKTRSFIARAVMEMLPSSAPAAIVEETHNADGTRQHTVVWSCPLGSVSFPYGVVVERAVSDFCNRPLEMDYLDWTIAEDTIPTERHLTPTFAPGYDYR